MFRSVTRFTAMSLFSAIVSNTAHAGEDVEGESDVFAVPETPPGAALIAPPSRRPVSKIGPQPVAREVLIGASAAADEDGDALGRAGTYAPESRAANAAAPLGSAGRRRVRQSSPNSNAYAA